MADEPSVAILKLLRTALTDHNSVDRVGAQWIYPDKPRATGDGALSKNSYPRISVLDIVELGEPSSIGANDRYIQTITLQIDVWIWSKDKDEMILTIDSVIYSGAKLRDKVAREVIDALRDNFYTDDNTVGIYYDLRFDGMQSLDFDEGEGIMRKMIEITFTKMQT